METDPPRSSAWHAHRRWAVVFTGTMAQAVSVFLALSQAGFRAQMSEPETSSIGPSPHPTSVFVREIDVEDARAEVERAVRPQG